MQGDAQLNRTENWWDMKEKQIPNKLGIDIDGDSSFLCRLRRKVGGGVVGRSLGGPPGGGGGGYTVG